jgi:CheY-like chemotaxis protein
VLFRNTLNDLEAELIWARLAQEAIDLIESGRVVDLVLMDIKMPFKDGYTATREIKKFNTSLPVIAQTAYSNPDEIHLCLEAGCDDYISKPIDYFELRFKMEKILRRNTLSS